MEKKWVLVECISQFRMRYMVEVPSEHPEYALDAVTMNEVREFSQEHIGETIVSHRAMTEQEALELCDQDNQYVVGKWSNDQKKKAFFTEEGYKPE